ncbi:MAG: Tex-like N-terminal domain-containing protein [Bilophila wadsworthia]
MQNYASIIAQELNIRPQQTEAVIRLLDEDATVPFIARYRKEATGSLDEVAVTAIRDRLAALKELDKRREAIRLAGGTRPPHARTACQGRNRRCADRP